MVLRCGFHEIRKFLENHGISCDLIDQRTVKPMDWGMIFESVKKTGRLLVLETGSLTGSIAGEIVAMVSTDCFDNLVQAPQRIGQPDYPTPTSPALTKEFYAGTLDIVKCVGEMLGQEFDLNALEKLRKLPHDVPGDWFKGPF